MNFELFNDKSKILINDSQNKAILFNHQQVLVEHLAYSIFQIEDNFLQDLFKEIKIDVNKIQIDFIIGILDLLPRASTMLNGKARAIPVTPKKRVTSKPPHLFVSMTEKPGPP